VLMVESEAKELPEDVMLGAVMFGHKGMQPVIDAIIRLAEKAAKDPRPVPEDVHAALREKLKAAAGKDLAAAFQIPEKHVRRDAIAAVRNKLAADYVGEGEGKVAANTFSNLMHDVEGHVMRNAVLDTKKRIDGRDLVTVRPIVAEVGALPRTHGSALFTRGETQALVVATLGTGEDEQFVDSLEGTTKQSFMLHYNFPPYSVGETGRMGAPSRRDIGHGKLAWRAVHPMLPSKEEFPYTLRVVSEITESNGSSSMATVCGTSLALMDAGVPVKRPIAGIAMGLILEGSRYAVLSDILGDEDHLGDMDFKVAGTENGVTSLQMDIKIAGITAEIMAQALEQARQGRLFILDRMAVSLGAPRTDISAYAPRILTIRIPVEKIRDVIGPGGKMIRSIVERTGCKIDIEDDGRVSIASVDEGAAKKAIAIIEELTATAEMNKTYLGKVVRVVDFGAFVEILPGTDGLLHVSEMSHHHVKDVRSEVKEGDQVLVKVVNIDPSGKIRLSRKALLEAPEGASEGGAPGAGGEAGGDHGRGPRGEQRGRREHGRDRDSRGGGHRRT
jgi:polyribonucleotide nucleotidyltransferase